MTQPTSPKSITLDLPTFPPCRPQPQAVPRATTTAAPTPTVTSPTPPSLTPGQPAVSPTMVVDVAAPKGLDRSQGTITPPATSPATHLPSLPKGHRPSLTSHRNDANATRAMDLLDQVDTTLSQWHQDLRQVLDEIQAVYLAGPIIEGWLEAGTLEPNTGHAPSGQAHTSLLRHGDPAHLATYVEQLTQPAATPSPRGGATQYRLCSLDADGRLQCQPCPPDQLGAISQGIARHQQLRTLVQRKQALETSLQKAATVLTTVCDQLDIIPLATS